ncbi:hypothetical protein MRX96_016086 [Rhipicephalus microplus]
MLKRNGEKTWLRVAACHVNVKVTIDTCALHQPAAVGGITKVDARTLKMAPASSWPTSLCTRVKEAFLLMNHEDLYGIVVAQVVSITRCTTVSACDFAG